ncbi:helix-turn-helix transcriptional regulator (plasmid) [Deinococcus radiomollis]|uniref:hypothetical protein n=1 Tax=Deinococcus radiomollis TaxID=468916 RepID=UPI00389245D0
MNARQTIKVALAEAGMTQAQLATRLEMKPQVLSQSLQSPLVNSRSHWPAILDALGLEVVIRPKQP